MFMHAVLPSLRSRRNDRNSGAEASKGVNSINCSSPVMHEDQILRDRYSLGNIHLPGSATRRRLERMENLEDKAAEKRKGRLVFYARGSLNFPSCLVDREKIPHPRQRPRLLERNGNNGSSLVLRLEIVCFYLPACLPL